MASDLSSFLQGKLDAQRAEVSETESESDRLGSTVLPPVEAEDGLDGEEFEQTLASSRDTTPEERRTAFEELVRRKLAEAEANPDKPGWLLQKQASPFNRDLKEKNPRPLVRWGGFSPAG